MELHRRPWRSRSSSANYGVRRGANVRGAARLDRVSLGAWLIVIGSIVGIVTPFLPFVTVDQRPLNGLDDFTTSSGVVRHPALWLILTSVILLIVGGIMLVRGPILFTAVEAIVVALAGALLGITALAAAHGAIDVAGDATQGMGANLAPVGPVIALLGAAHALHLRTWEPPVPETP
jgi:hypothetical protein